MKRIIIAISILSTVALGGCFDIELQVPVITQVATVEGNQALFMAKATLHGEVLQPARIEDGLGFGDQAIGQVYLEDFTLMLTNDARAGIDDIDDLDFVESMTIYVRSLDESSGLKEVAIAWFYREESPDSTPSQLVFESDPELNLKAYVDGGFELFSKGVSRVPADDVSVEGIATFTAIPQ
jgi:hypothetical protein